MHDAGPASSAGGDGLGVLIRWLAALWVCEDGDSPMQTGRAQRPISP